jgi:hypothetical protein
MNSSNFYVPHLAKLTGRELMFAQESLDKQYRQNSELDIPDFDFAAPATSHPVMTRRVGMEWHNKPEDFDPEFFDMGPFQITYNFSNAARKNNFPMKNALPLRPKATKEYGAANFSFRMLYEFLCEVYNRGEPFVDTYFKQGFKTRSVYAAFKDIYATIQDDINEEQFSLFASLPLKADRTPDMRFKVSKRYMDFKVWQDPIVKQDCKSIANEIRRDIAACLSTGRIPLRGRQGSTISKWAKKRRDELVGMKSSNLLFYASGQLINHLNIFVKVGEVPA